MYTSRMCTGYCTKMLPRLQVKILTGRQTSKKNKHLQQMGH